MAALVQCRRPFTRTAAETPATPVLDRHSETQSCNVIDKFFNVLADWGSYASPVAAHALPFSVAANLALGAHFDIAVRDIVLSIAAFTLARALEAVEAEPARAAAPASSTRVVTA